LVLISTGYDGCVFPIPRYPVFGVYTKLEGAISNFSKNPPALSLVNPKYLGAPSVGSITGVSKTVIVAIPSPGLTSPVAVTLLPTKFNLVIDPATPTRLPSSKTVIPNSKTPGGIGVQYLMESPPIPMSMY
jgi:hypothetical protein